MQRGERLAAQVAQPHKPLRRRAEDDRRLGAPVVRVAVLVPRSSEQGAALAKRSQHRLVPLIQHGLAGKARSLLGRSSEAALLIDRASGGQAVRDADRKVLWPMPRRRVDQPGARVVRHVLRMQNWHRTRRERVRTVSADQRGAGKRRCHH